ncbi:MAG: hypothetical protein WCF78_02135 [archaeon]
MPKILVKMPTLKPQAKKPLFISRINGENKLSKATKEKLNENTFKKIKDFQNSGKHELLEKARTKAFLLGLFTEKAFFNTLILNSEFKAILDLYRAEKNPSRKAKLLSKLKIKADYLFKLEENEKQLNKIRAESVLKADALKKERLKIETDAIEKERRLKAYNFRKGIYKKK